MTQTNQLYAVKAKCHQSGGIFLIQFKKSGSGFRVIRAEIPDPGKRPAEEASAVTLTNMDWSGYPGCSICNTRKIVRCGRCRKLTYQTILWIHDSRASGATIPELSPERSTVSKAKPVTTRDQLKPASWPPGIFDRCN